MNEALSIYDVSLTLANIDAHLPRVLIFGALALLCNFVYFGTGIYLGFKHQVVSMPIVATLVFLPHDLTYVLMYDNWFNVHDHWFPQLFWVGLIITSIEEMCFFYLALRYGRQEHMPGVSQGAWTALLLLGLAGTSVAFLSVKAALADELWLFSFGWTLWFCVPLVIPMMMRRGSAAGQSRLMWCAYIGIGVCYWIALYPLDPFFRSTIWLALGAVIVLWGSAVLWTIGGLTRRKDAGT